MTVYRNWHGMRIAIPRPKTQPGGCGARAETSLANPNGEAGAPNLPSWQPLSQDDAECALLECLAAMPLPGDDKLLIAELRRRDLWIYRRVA